MKFQIMYECPDLNFQASYEKLIQSNVVTADFYEKGNLWVHFKNFKVLFVISPKGKIQVAFEDPKQKEILVELLRGLLVSTTGNEVVLHPLKQNLTVDYPAPKEIELWWCGEKDSYIHQEEAQSIMSLPEAKEADWSKIPDDVRLQIIFEWESGTAMIRDVARATLRSYAKKDDSQQTKSLIEKAKDRLTSRKK